MLAPIFEFFEVVAEELATTVSKVITREDLQIADEESLLLDALREDMRAESTDEAIRRAATELEKHFRLKGAVLPFKHDPTTGRFTAVDQVFLSFVKEMNSIRSIGKRSRDFECTVAKRLSARATGSIHRVGHPRDKKTSKDQFNKYLKSHGFVRPVLLGKDKDGGLDILWYLPMGTMSHRPIVSVQCKNGVYNADEAYKSIGAASSSFAQHGGLQTQVHLPCVLFNDYIYPEMLPAKPLSFVPLGLTDLAPLEQAVSVVLI